jgi:hypothetical protein
MNDDFMLACVDLVARSGATEFQIGFTGDEGVSAEDAGWYAMAIWQGARIMTDEHKSPSQAVFALTERLLDNATCRCGKKVTLSDSKPGCRWKLNGQRWEPGCDVPGIKVDGKRGDLKAIVEALLKSEGYNREQRRAMRRRKK